MKALPVITVNNTTYFVDSRLSELRDANDPQTVVPLPRLKMQEVPYEAESSCYRFRPSNVKPFVTTNGAGVTYGPHVIRACLAILQQDADEHNGLDYLQVFDDQTDRSREPLWFIEDGDGGAITALLPSDY
jgi:hypothetical protein